MNKLLEIAAAWIAKANPTEEQKKLAEKRLAICEGCEYKRHNKLTNHHYCGECGCPLAAKIFSPLPGKEACPLAKWEE